MMALSMVPADQLSSSEIAFKTEVWVLQAIIMLVVGLRYYACLSSATGLARLNAEDWLMAAAMFFYTFQSVGSYLMIVFFRGLSNSGLSDEARAALDPNSIEWAQRVTGSQNHIATKMLYTTVLWLTKGCWLMYYHRLTDNVLHTRLFIKTARWLVPLTYVACMLLSFVRCIPFSEQWQINPAPSNNCMPAVSALQTIFVMIVNTMTDLFLIAIPLPVVWTSRLPTSKKIFLGIMFSGGFLQIIFGILRCVNILKLGRGDSSLSGYWSVRETFVSMILANLPIVYPLIRQCYCWLGQKLGLRSRTGVTASSAAHNGALGYQLNSRTGTAVYNASRARMSMHDAYLASSSRAKLTGSSADSPPPLPKLKEKADGAESNSSSTLGDLEACDMGGGGLERTLTRSTMAGEDWDLPVQGRADGDREKSSHHQRNRSEGGGLRIPMPELFSPLVGERRGSQQSHSLGRDHSLGHNGDHGGMQITITSEITVHTEVLDEKERTVITSGR